VKLDAANSFHGGITIESGKLELAVAGAAGTGAISFAKSATGAELIIDGTTLPNEIEGFTIGDSIRLTGIAYSRKDEVVVATAGTVTIETGTKNYSLHIAGAYVGETNFNLSSGLVLTETASDVAVSSQAAGLGTALEEPAKMAFLSPPDSKILSPTSFPELAAPYAAITMSRTAARLGVSAQLSGWLGHDLLRPATANIVNVTLHG
jgi:hypothetical protein